MSNNKNNLHTIENRNVWDFWSKKKVLAPKHKNSRLSVFGFWFVMPYAATQLPRQLHQTRIQVVRSNKEARKRLTESKGTPAMDLGHMNVVLKWCVCMLAYVGIVDIYIITILMCSVLVFGCWFVTQQHYLAFFLSGPSETQPNYWNVVLSFLGFEYPT